MRRVKQGKVQKSMSVWSLVVKKKYAKQNIAAVGSGDSDIFKSAAQLSEKSMTRRRLRHPVLWLGIKPKRKQTFNSKAEVHCLLLLSHLRHLWLHTIIAFFFFFFPVSLD